MSSRRDVLFLILGGFFLTNAILGEMIGGKLFFLGDPSFELDLGWFKFGPFVMSVGVVIPWPVVFLTTDLVNEYYATRGVRRLTFLGIGMVSYVFLVLFAALQIRATHFSTPYRRRHALATFDRLHRDLSARRHLRDPGDRLLSSGEAHG